MQPKYLGPFRIIRVIGRGGMGAVYEAVRIDTLEKAAVKVLLSPVEEDEELRLRFEVEIDTLKKLRHPNIVRLFGFGEEQQVLYYVMEYIDGQSLQQELRQKRHFTWAEVCKIGLEIALALKHAHDRGIIHRDIKPANILLEYSGEVKLSDFGIAHIYGGNRLTNINSVVGTLEYMSPEQSQAGPIGPKSDLYSLGAVLYTLLVGTPPFPAKTLPEVLQQHQAGPPPKIIESRTDVPEMLEAVIMEMLSIKPESRPTNAYILGRRLQAILKAYMGNPGLIKIRPSEKEETPANSDTPQQPVPQSPNPEDRQRFVDSREIDGMDQAPLTDPSRLQETSTQLRFAQESPAGKEPSVEKQVEKESAPRQTRDSSSRRSRKNPRTSTRKKYIDWRNPSEIARKRDLLRRQEAEHVGVTKSQIRPISSLSGSEAPQSPDAVEPVVTPRSFVDLASHGTSAKPENLLDVIQEAKPGEKKRSRFIPVTEEELGDLSKYDERPAPKAVSFQTIFLSACLLLIGFFIYYLLQPVSADTLYERITRSIEADNTNGSEIPSVSKILRAERNIEHFIELYPNDPRRERMDRYLEEIKLDKLQREFDSRVNRLQDVRDLQPLERMCLEAFALSRIQPEKAAARFQAILDLYGSNIETFRDETTDPSSDDSGEEKQATEEQREEKTKPEIKKPRINPDYILEGRPRSESRNDLCLEIVRRRLNAIQRQSAVSVEEQKELLKKWLDDAAELDWSHPDRADTIRQGIIVLYEDKEWATPFVQRAQQERESERK